MYEQYEQYDVCCRLLKANTYCKKYEGAPCCYFLQGQRKM